MYRPPHPKARACCSNAFELVRMTEDFYLNVLIPLILSTLASLDWFLT